MQTVSKAESEVEFRGTEGILDEQVYLGISKLIYSCFVQTIFEVSEELRDNDLTLEHTLVYNINVYVN